MTVDEKPVAEDVAEVRGDEREGDGTDVVEGLQVAAQGEVEEEGWGSPVEGSEEGDGAEEHPVVDGQAHHDDGREADEDSGDAEAEGVVEDLSEGGGGDGERGVGHVADHHGVDDAHRHPAEFSEDEGKGEREHRPDLLAYGHSRCVPLLPRLGPKLLETNGLRVMIRAKYSF